jgi:hypothetical protein
VNNIDKLLDVLGIYVAIIKEIAALIIFMKVL